MVSAQNRQRINVMRKERNIEKTKIQQSILMSKHEEARQAKLKAQQEGLPEPFVLPPRRAAW